MADREFSWQKENPASDPSALAKIKADIDARNPTKPGQFTGKPVPLNQKEYQKPLSRVERLKERLEEENTTDVEDIMMTIMDFFNDTVTPVPDVGSFYTFIYQPKTPKIQYDQQPLIACTDIFRWGFRGINFHWQSPRNYTWGEVVGQLYAVRSQELDDLLSLQYGKFLINR